MPSNRDTSSLNPEKVNSVSTVCKPATFVVAFALKETYDDLVTAQQMICNKRSPQASTNSLTPSHSLKLLESTQTIKLESIQSPTNSNDCIVEKKKENEENNLQTPQLQHSKTSIEDANQNKIIHFIETDDTTDSDTTIENASSEKKLDDIVTSENNVSSENNKKSDQPEIIFNAKNYSQRSKESKFSKKKTKIHKSNAPKCNKFKCKVQKNYISNRLEKFYQKAKQNSITPEHIREGISNISTVVSRTSVLKNCSAKENLLDGTELVESIGLLDQRNENDDGSQFSNPSTVKNDSFISNPSINTLTYVSSRTSLKHEDLNSIDTLTNFEISSEPPVFKTDVINVAVAVSYKPQSNLSKEKISINETFMHLGSLTSQFEPLSMEVSKVTCDVPLDLKSDQLHTMKSINSNKELTVTDEISDATLANAKSSFDMSSDDFFDMARTSSDFNEITSSLTTLKKDIKDESNNGENEFVEVIKTNNRKQSILQTVINLGYYPDTPSTSSHVTVAHADQKDVFITDASQNYRVLSKNMGDHLKENKESTNIFKKQFNDQDISSTKKPTTRPNQDDINEMLNNDMHEMKPPEESKMFFNVAEFWDKLIMVLDFSFRKIETAITEKIINELKNSIATLELRAQPIPEVDMDLEKSEILVIEPPQQEVISAQQFKETDRSLQCNLVKSAVIDKIMLTRSTQGPKIESDKSANYLEKLKSKLVADCLQILKPPIVVGPEVLEDKGDTMTISTVRTETFHRLHRLKIWFLSPIRFVRENLFVITSVPAFFVVLLFVYGILMLLIKPM